MHLLNSLSSCYGWLTMLINMHLLNSLSTCYGWLTMLVPVKSMTLLPAATADSINALGSRGCRRNKMTTRTLMCCHGRCQCCIGMHVHHLRPLIALTFPEFKFHKVFHALCSAVPLVEDVINDAMRAMIQSVGSYATNENC